MTPFRKYRESLLVVETQDIDQEVENTELDRLDTDETG